MKDISKVPTDRLGRLGSTEDGATFVQFVRLLPYSPEAVWQAITDADSLAKWFPGFQLDVRQGGKFNIWFGGECEGPAHVAGAVEVCGPPNELRCGSMSWRLLAVADGCQLTFTDIVNMQQGDLSEVEITNSVLAGWHFYMDQLDASLAGRLDVLGARDKLEFDYSQLDVSQLSASSDASDGR